MVNLNPAQITAKCVEVSKCLLNATGGLLYYDLGVTKDIGDAARLAVSIKQLQDRLEQKTLAGISAALKIDFRIVESKIIPLFQDLNWVSDVRLDNKRLSSFIEQIPPTQDILSTLGKQWKEQNPTIIDEATINAISNLVQKPYGKAALISELNIEDEQFNLMFDYGKQANYMGVFKSNEGNTETIWSPLYWAGKTDKVLSFLQRQSNQKFDELALLTQEFKSFAGKPKRKISNPNSPLIEAGIWSGYFPSVGINDRQGDSHEYLFTASPQFEIDLKTDIFEKARKIVACIRHGQFDAEITKILFPRAILKAMRTSSMRPHSYANIQYAVLVLDGTIKLTKYEGKYRIEWVNTPENNLAADIADQLLAGEEIISTSKEEIEAKKVLVQGIYTYSSEQRRIRALQEIKATKEFERLIELVSGIKL